MASWRTQLKGVTGEKPARSRNTRELEIRKLLHQLVAALTDPKHRQAAVQVVQQKCLPLVQSLVIGRLVEIVKRGGKAHGDALASLVEFGPPALRVLMQDLERSDSTAVQLRLVEALRVFAGRPSFSEHVDLTMVLASMLARVADPDLRTAIANLMTILRRGAGTHRGAVR
jgi:hypothetical protein